ncbi:hypothetical protein MUK42_15533 [Musa troglodytarum]|uniref:Uncharacterized protein n=1 Tax=Musa troglodytarum TaxID=320322 RepID=A0A9E7HNZ8_9LILI|nr:hypothetical protein MUK42_15533 [Musa troglodytarum]
MVIAKQDNKDLNELSSIGSALISESGSGAFVLGFSFFQGSMTSARGLSRSEPPAAALPAAPPHGFVPSPLSARSATRSPSHRSSRCIGGAGGVLSTQPPPEPEGDVREPSGGGDVPQHLERERLPLPPPLPAFPAVVALAVTDGDLGIAPLQGRHYHPLAPLYDHPVAAAGNPNPTEPSATEARIPRHDPRTHQIALQSLNSPRDPRNASGASTRDHEGGDELLPSLLGMIMEEEEEEDCVSLGASSGHRPPPEAKPRSGTASCSMAIMPCIVHACSKEQEESVIYQSEISWVSTSREANGHGGGGRGGPRGPSQRWSTPGGSGEAEISLQHPSQGTALSFSRKAGGSHSRLLRTSRISPTPKNRGLKCWLPQNLSNQIKSDCDIRYRSHKSTEY